MKYRFLGTVADWVIDSLDRGKRFESRPATGVEIARYVPDRVSLGGDSRVGSDTVVEFAEEFEESLDEMGVDRFRHPRELARYAVQVRGPWWVAVDSERDGFNRDALGRFI